MSERRERTRRHRRARGAVVAVVAVALLAGCGIPTDDEPRPLADETTTTGTETVPADADASTVVYLVRDTETLEPVRRGLAGPRSPKTVLDTLLVTPTEDEEDDGLSTAIPLGTVAVDVAEQDDLVVVDLSSGWTELAQPNALVAYAQVVLTLTEVPGVERVQFLVEGEAVAAPTVSDGDLDTVTAENYAELDPD